MSTLRVYAYSLIRNSMTFEVPLACTQHTKVCRVVSSRKKEVERRCRLARRPANTRTTTATTSVPALQNTPSKFGEEQMVSFDRQD